MGNKDYKSVRHKYYNWILVLLVIVVNQVTTTEAASKYRCVPKDQSIPIGSNVTICCQLNDNSATSLMKGTFLILTGAEKSYWDQDQMARYKILGMGKLMITNVNERDDSAYGCSSNAGNIAFYITVQLPPDAPSVSSDESVYNSGENATLTCTSSGKPAPNIYWMSKNRRYMGVSAVNGRTTTNTLSIIVSREHNKQTFACYVYNDVNVGQPLQRTMIFDIRYPPYVRIKERINQDPFKVIEYTRMSLTCEVDANPPASKIKWMKNNEFLKDRTHSSSIDEFRLSQNVSKENNSRYECRAENTLGTESDSISVEVLYHPRVSVESDVEVTLHSHVILNCSADANPPASIKWIGKNHQIRNDNTFIISNVRVGDAGKYTCEAHNNLHSSTGMNKTGSAAAVTNLHVRYAPGSATLRLRGTSIKGQDIVLICDLPVNQVGYPPPSFKWRKLADNYLKETSNTLIISNSTLSNTGQYTCKARNIEGEGGTGSYYVKVKEYPEFQKKLNRILYLNITDPSPNLMCKVRGNPSPNVTWHKDGRPVSRFDYTVDHQKPQPHDNSFVVTSYLHFKNFTTNNVRKLRPSDTGNYSCVVTTLLNQTFELKSTLQIIIQSPPQPNKKNDIVAITLNENSSISIIVQAYPPPTFSWSKNNVALPFHIVFEKLGVNRYRSTLKIRSATRSDLGVYKCDVSNSYGSLVIRRDIRERSDPDPPRNLSSVDATWESVYLKWIPGFNGGEKQTFIISYSHDKKNYSVEVAAENTRYIYYNVTNLMPDTTYIFSVRGRSDLGTGRPSNSFSVHTIYLVLPSPENVRYIVAEKKISFEVKTDYECCTSLLIAKNGDDLKDLRCEPTVKRWKNNTVDLPNNEVEAVSVGLCLKRRNELCGNYIQAIKVEPNMSAGPLSTFHVIVIAVVCGIILIVLVVILILFLYWRSRSHKKQYGNEVNYPHISNGSVPNGIAGRQGYDNPDGPYSNGYVENTHNTSSEHTDELPPYTDQDMGQELSDESDLDKPYDPRHIDTMTFYNNPHITRNPNFISLNPEGMMPRDTSISGRESGYSTPDSTRPKKVIYEVIV